MKKVAIIDYGLGNLRSLAGALEKIESNYTISSDHAELSEATHLILPGVGAFGDGMSNLKQKGLDQLLNKLVLEQRKPFLGICLGAQLVAQESFEFGHHQGLGWIDASVKRFDVESKSLRVPHVGWNDLIQIKNSALFSAIPKDALFYYVHSFFISTKNYDQVIGLSDYGSEFPVVLQNENIFATQFHPEKSQQHGLTLLRNFVGFEYAA